MALNLDHLCRCNHLNIQSVFVSKQVNRQMQIADEQPVEEDVTVLFPSAHPFAFVICSLGTGHLSIAGCTYHSFIPRGNLESPVNLTSLFQDCGRKPEYLEKTCAHMRRTRERNQESDYDRAIVLTTESPWNDFH